MNISLLTYGSRGDVQPFVALAKGLGRAGHNVRLVAPQGFAGLAEEHSIPFVPLAGDPEELSARLNDARGNVFGMVKNMFDYVRAIATPVAQVAFSACEDADLIIHSFLFTTGAHSLAKARGIPDVSVQGFPIFAPTRAFPMVAVPKLPQGGISYFSHWLGVQLFWHMGNAGYRQLRGRAPGVFDLELAWPWSDSNALQTPLIFAYSPTVLPRPEDWTGKYIYIPGYFFLDAVAGYGPPQPLVDFLAAGDKPVCVTFGSMVNQAASKIQQIVAQALQTTGQRAIFLSGWSGTDVPEFDKDFFGLKSAPHDWLFSKCKAVIHHGGAGTTGAVLRAGLPSIVVPHGMDQLFWGKQVAKLGVGPSPMEISRLSVNTVSAAISQVNDFDMRLQAQKLGKIIQAEDGVSEAIHIIEKHAADFKSTH